MRRDVSIDSTTLILEYRFIAAYIATRRISFSFYTLPPSPPPLSKHLIGEIAIGMQCVRFSRRERLSRSFLCRVRFFPPAFSELRR